MTAENSTDVDPTERRVFSDADSGAAVRGVRLCELPHFVDFRGSLSFAEYPGRLPFLPRRFFLTYEVPNQEVRGEHAHRACHQFLVCVTGNCSVIVDDGEQRAETILDRPNLGLYIPPMVWSVEYKHSPQAVLLVLASDIYQPNDYIRDYALFLHELQTVNR